VGGEEASVSALPLSPILHCLSTERERGGWRRKRLQRRRKEEGEGRRKDLVCHPQIIIIIHTGLSSLLEKEQKATKVYQLQLGLAP